MFLPQPQMARATLDTTRRRRRNDKTDHKLK